MNIQQANFVKNILKEGCSLNRLAEEFFNKFGATEYCTGPTNYYSVRGKKIPQFSSLDGNDIKTSTEIFLNEKL